MIVYFHNLLTPFRRSWFPSKSSFHCNLICFFYKRLFQSTFLFQHISKLKIKCRDMGRRLVLLLLVLIHQNTLECHHGFTMTRISIVIELLNHNFLVCAIHNHILFLRKIGCCQLGVYISVWKFAEFLWQENHLNKQTNKQTNKQQSPFDNLLWFNFKSLSKDLNFPLNLSSSSTLECVQHKSKLNIKCRDLGRRPVLLKKGRG